MNVRRGTPRSSPRRGIAAVEAALTLPLILLMLLGMWEVGRMVQVQQLVENSAREAGRQASTGLRTLSEIEAQARDYLTHAGISTTGMTLTCQNLTDATRSDPTTATQLDRFKLVVSLPTSNVRWVAVGPFITDSRMVSEVEWTSMKDVPLTVSGTIPVE